MTVATFTPAKFASLALAAGIIALGTAGSAPAHQRSNSLDLSSLYRPADAVGPDEGSLTSHFYLATSYTPVTPTRGTEHRGTSTTPQAPQPAPRHSYPPLAR